MLPTISAVLLFSCVLATVFGVSVIVSDGSDFIFLCVSCVLFFYVTTDVGHKCL